MRKMRKILLAVFSCIMILLSVNVDTYADVLIIGDNGHKVIIKDNANLLNDDEEDKLAQKMLDITKYGNVAFVSNDEYCSSTSSFAENAYRKLFGIRDGTIFVIDMYNREIYIFSDGKIYNTITVAYAHTITDNTYKFAKNGKYYECAEEAFDEIYTLLSGHRIARPMKYISNVLIAVIVAFIINYFVVKSSLSGSKANRKRIMSSMNYHCNVENVSMNFLYQTKVYIPPSSSSSGHSGGGHRSGGGGGHRSSGGGGHRSSGGGHRSGGGGGHRF